jgi:hypothetical protein
MVGKKLGFGTCSNLNWGNRTRSRNSSKCSGKNWNLEFAQISIGGIGLDLEFFQTVGEWDLELTQISIGGIRPGLEILPNGHGKIV